MDVRHTSSAPHHFFLLRGLDALTLRRQVIKYCLFVCLYLYVYLFCYDCFPLLSIAPRVCVINVLYRLHAPREQVGHFHSLRCKRGQWEIEQMRCRREPPRGQHSAGEAFLWSVHFVQAKRSFESRFRSSFAAHHVLIGLPLITYPKEKHLMSTVCQPCFLFW